MSRAHEVIVAAHSGMQCLGISLITNVGNDVCHEEVLDVGKERCKDLTKLLKCFVQKLS
jgi:purine nucleoside phosphorylase